MRTPVDPTSEPSNATQQTPTTPPIPKSPIATASSELSSPMSNEPVDCIICLSSLPAAPLTNEEDDRVAQLVPCSHVMHDTCLKQWSGIANTCPVCRVSFNEVNVLAHLQGSVLDSYPVEDKKQRVADEGDDYDGEETELDYELDPTWFPRDEARQIREWNAAWARLDADLEQIEGGEYADSEEEEYYSARATAARRRSDEARQRRNQQHRERMEMRRIAAAAQVVNQRTAFDIPQIWKEPTTRPRESFPHIQPQISKEESDAWKMMEIAEKIENTKKRRRTPVSEDDLLARMGVTVQQSDSGRKFKRPRTKRDSQLPARNNGETSKAAASSSASSAAVKSRYSNVTDVGSSGGVFTSLLAGLGKVPVKSASR